MANVTDYQFNVNKYSCVCTCFSFQRLKGPAAEGIHNAVNMTASLLLILTFIPGIFLNAIVLKAYRRNKRLQISSNTSLMALAVIDLLVCAIVQPLLTVRKIAEMYTTFHCFLWTASKAMLQCGFCVSLTTTTLISVERFLTLAFPFGSQVFVTQKRLKISLSLSYIFCCIIVMSQMWMESFKGKSSIVYSTLIIVHLLVITAAWLWIHRLTSRHRQEINTLNTPSDVSNTVKNTKTCYLVVASTILCYLPKFAILVFYSTALNKENAHYFINHIIDPFCTVLMCASSALNPVILLHRKKAFRETVKHAVLC